MHTEAVFLRWPAHSARARFLLKLMHAGAEQTSWTRLTMAGGKSHPLRAFTDCDYSGPTNAPRLAVFL